MGFRAVASTNFCRHQRHCAIVSAIFLLASCKDSSRAKAPETVIAEQETRAEELRAAIERLE